MNKGITTDWIHYIPQGIKAIPSFWQVVLVIGLLVALSRVQQTAKLATWLGVIVLLDAVLVGLQGK